MNQQDREQFLEKYNERTHLFGRIGLWVGIVMLIGAPFVMGISLDAMPNLSLSEKVWPRSPSSTSPAVS